MVSIFWHSITGYSVEMSYFLRAFLALITGGLIWALAGDFFIKTLYECKIGQKIRMEECPLLGKLHEKKKETPTMGGALILIAAILSGLLWMDLSHPFTWVVFICSLAMGSIGAVDDWLKLKWKNTEGLAPRKKMRLQTLVASFVVFCMATNGFDFISNTLGVDVIDFTYPNTPAFYSLSKAMSLFYLPLFNMTIELPNTLLWGLILFGFFWFVVTGSSNAVNLTDGLDGLAGGLIALVCLTMAAIAAISGDLDLARSWKWIYVAGSHEIGVFLCALAGGCIGFLWYNAHPAQVFMGDTGSLGMGGVLGACAILMRQEFLFALASTVFVVETLSVMLQVWSFRKYKKRIFLCSPLHHHFEYKGMAETKVVARFWIIGLVFSMLTLVLVFGRG